MVQEKGKPGVHCIAIYTPEKMPLEVTNEKVSKVIGKRLQELGIRLFTGQQFINVDPEQQEVHFATGKAPFDLLLYIPQNLRLFKTAPWLMKQGASRLIPSHCRPNGTGFTPWGTSTASRCPEGVSSL